MDLLTGPVLLIANPAARRAERLRALARHAFRVAGVRCDELLTERPGHAAELAAERLGGYAAVFTLGGDGTAMEVIGALAHQPVPVGVLPGGTGNLVARALGIPLRIDAAVPALLGGDVARVDLGLLDSGRRFAFTVGVGVDARMIAETPPPLKRRFGIAAYALTAARVALRRRLFRAMIVVDGEPVEREAAALMVANFGTVLSELLVLGPGILHDDGALDLCVFSPKNTADAIRVAWRLLRRDFSSDDAMFYRPGRHFQVACEPPQLVQADGEVVGTTPFAVTVEPRAASLLIPRRTD